MRKTLLYTGLGTLAIAGSLLGATAASAAPAAGPGCSTNANCEVDGSVTVMASITLTLTSPPPFTFSDGSLVAGATSAHLTTSQFATNVVSSDGGGYVLDAAGGTDFVAGANHFPATDLSIYSSASGYAAALPLAEPGGATQIGANAGPTTGAGDGLGFSTTVTPPNTAGAGNYTIPVQLTAIGN